MRDTAGPEMAFCNEHPLIMHPKVFAGVPAQLPMKK